MISVPYTEYLKFRKNWILYTQILTKKYHIPELKWPGIPYTQNPWPGLTGRFATTIFNATQRCDVGTMFELFKTMLQRCVTLKIVVANRPVQHHLKGGMLEEIPLWWPRKWQWTTQFDWKYVDEISEGIDMSSNPLSWNWSNAFAL